MPKFFYALAIVLFVAAGTEFVSGGEGAAQRGFACLACALGALTVAASKNLKK